jgi:hypothetical protein
MKELTNIPEAEMLNQLKYLCNPKQKILDKDLPKTPDFKPDEKMRVSQGFVNPNVKVTFSPPQKQ